MYVTLRGQKVNLELTLCLGLSILCPFFFSNTFMLILYSQ